MKITILMRIFSTRRKGNFSSAKRMKNSRWSSLLNIMLRWRNTKILRSSWKKWRERIREKRKRRLLRKKLRNRLKGQVRKVGRKRRKLNNRNTVNRKVKKITLINNRS